MLNAVIAMLHPLLGDTFCRPTLARHATQIVVHADFVVEIIKACRYIRIVLIRVVALADDEVLLVFLLHLWDSPCEELHRHHFRHIDTDAVDAFSCPEEHDIAHLDPCAWDGVKLLLATILIEHAVVQFDGLIPVVLARMAGKAVVPGHLSRIFIVALQVFIHSESLARQVIEVIERRESPLRVVILTKVLHSGGFAEALVFTAHMIRHKVDKDA